MTVEIWSDLQCPFCYIGKRHFEAGLAAFPGKEDVQVIWRSFQLNPGLKPEPGKDIYTYLAEHKGMSRAQSVDMHRQVTDMAAAAGLQYDFDRTVLANTYDAHRLIQFAKTQGLGDAAEERLFRAYSTEGADLNDAHTLVQLATEIGLDRAAAEATVHSKAYAAEVDEEVAMAQELGVRGVPFFVFDRKYAVSGAQPPEAFLNALQQTAGPAADGAACAPGGDCA